MVLLWVFCVPMFPQLFIRFYIAREERSLKIATVLYILTPILLFICPVIIGLFGHISYPNLQSGDIDSIFPMLLNAHLDPMISALIMIGALAALMSTLDSQLLATSTMVTRDIYLALINPEASLKRQVLVGRMLIIVMAGLGLAIAYSGVTSIFELGKQAFMGFAVLCPSVLALLWLKKTSTPACLLSIFFGEALVIASYFDWISPDFFFGFDGLIPSLLFSATVFLLDQRRR